MHYVYVYVCTTVRSDITSSGIFRSFIAFRTMENWYSRMSQNMAMLYLGELDARKIVLYCIVFLFH